MEEIATFQKVTFGQFLQDSKMAGFVNDDTDPDQIRKIWERIRMPARATDGSAGYDFYLPYSFTIYAMHNRTIPTGIRAEINHGWFLALVPRSGLGFKYGFRLLNTIGIIDADYCYAKNEGHIMAGISVSSNMCLQEGDRFAQGIFLPYGIVKDDDPLQQNRTGGFGSTGVS